MSFFEILTDDISHKKSLLNPSQLRRSLRREQTQCQEQRRAGAMPMTNGYDAGMTGWYQPGVLTD